MVIVLCGFSIGSLLCYAVLFLGGGGGNYVIIAKVFKIVFSLNLFYSLVYSN